MQGFEYRIEYKKDNAWYGIGDPKERGFAVAEQHYNDLMRSRGHTEKTLRLLSREVGDWRVERGEDGGLENKKIIATECLKNICYLFSAYAFRGGDENPSDVRLRSLFEEIKKARDILAIGTDAI